MPAKPKESRELFSTKPETGGKEDAHLHAPLLEEENGSLLADSLAIAAAVRMGVPEAVAIAAMASPEHLDPSA